jgi:tetratricopeptide (TPR) repeat protein
MKLIRSLLAASTLVALVTLSPAHAQSAAEYVSRGDRAHAAFDPVAALAAYDSALALEPNNAEALGKASRSAVDIGESEQNSARRDSLYRTAAQRARAAVAANPRDPENHFHLARALGRAALSVGVRDRVRYATEIRAAALKALELDPKHPGALHVMGVWNAEVMRLNSVERFFARNVLGGGTLGSANWKDAVSYMEQAVAVDPDRIAHRLDLGKIYLDVNEKAKAREQLELVVASTNRMDVSDPLFKREAQELLARIR